ncbi:MAG: hypothetical protein ACFBZ9_10570 [Sphingomonadales bacterium]
MPWAKILLTVTQIVRSLTEYAERKQLLDAGQAMEVAKHNAKALEAMRRVARAHGTDDDEWVQSVYNKYDDDHPLS